MLRLLGGWIGSSGGSIKEEEVPNKGLTFSLIGGFEGDDVKKAKAMDLQTRLLGSKADETVGVEEMAEFLDSLPFNGRLEFVIHVLSRSSARDSLVLALFDWCFQGEKANGEESDEGFVMMGCGGTSYLNTQRYPIMRCILSLLGKDEKLAIQLFEKYIQTTSTTFRTTFLQAMANNSLFIDAKLEETYLTSVENDKKVIMECCKKNPLRADLVAKLVKCGKLDPSFTPFAPSSFVRSSLFSEPFDPASPKMLLTVGFQNWKLHSAVYLDFLKEQFEKYSNDPLGKGVVLRAFERQVTEKMSPVHATEVYKLVDDYSPLEVVGATQGVKEYLTRVSKAGKLTSRYEHVRLALPSARIYVFLPAPVKFVLFKTLLIETEAGVVFRETHIPFCQSFLSMSHKRFRKSLSTLMLPYIENCFKKISIIDFWRTLVPVHGTSPSPVAVAFNAFKNHCKTNLVPKKITHSIIILHAWVALYSRAAPTPQLMKELGLSKSAMSDLWLSSFLNFFLSHLEKVAQKAACVLVSESLNRQRSSITCYVGYTSLLLSYVRDSLTLESLACSSGLLMKSVNKAVAASAVVCNAFKEEFLVPTSSPAACEKKISGLKTLMEELLLLTLKVTEASISAHPSNEGYADMNRLSELRGSLFSLFTTSQLARFAVVRQRTFDFAVHLKEKLELDDERLGEGFVEVIGEDGKVRLCPFNVQYHSQYVSLSFDLLQNIIQSYHQAPEDDLVAKVWDALKVSFPVPNHDNADSYVRAVTNLPKGVQKLERSSLLSLGTSLFATKKLTNPIASLYAQIGLLEEVVQSSPENASTKDLLLLLYGDLQSEGVRELLEEKTRDRDANNRMEAHCTLLTRSITSFAEVTTSLSYVQERIKNEAGLYRPTVYSWITSNIQRVVALSLDEEEEGLPDTKKCVEALVKMLRNDVSKRDSVAKNTFQKLASLIVLKALTHNNGKSSLKVREEWVNGGVLLLWTIKKTILGDSGWQTFEWPLGDGRFPTTHMVAEESLEGVFKEAFDKYYRNGTYFCTILKKKIFSQGLQIHSSDVFTPEMAVRLLLSSLLNVQKSQLDGSDPETKEWIERGADELIEDKFFRKAPQGKPASMTKIRMEALFQFTSTLWTHSPQLVCFLEKITSGLAPENRKHPSWNTHFNQSVSLFWTIKGMYPQGSVWYEVVPLRNLSHALFAAALELKSLTSTMFMTIWREEKEGFGKADLSNLSLNQIQFIATNCSTLHTMYLEKKSDKLRKCEMLRIALELCPSAIHILSSDLIAARDDMIGKYLGAPRSECHGVFDPTYSKGVSSKDLAKPFRLVLTSAQVASLGRNTLGCHTRLALDEAMDVSKSPGERSRAVAQFVESPVSGHQEIINLLKRLLANRSEEDGALDVLLETVILSVFSTDATWFVLAYLLSPQVVSTSPQRTTASILTQMKKWIPVAKVVGVVQILLEPKRRWALQLFLFKSILRLLFDCNIAEGANIFLREWENRYETKMHKDLQYEMVRLSVGAIPSKTPISSAAWKVVESIATDPKASNEILLLLLMPRWAPPSSVFVIQKALNTAYAIPRKQELGDFLKLCSDRPGLGVVSFWAEDVAARVKDLMGLIQNTHPNSPISTLAFVHQFTLSRAVLGEEDDHSIHTLHSLIIGETVQQEGKSVDITNLSSLSPALDTLPEATHYLLHTVPKLYVGLLLRVLNRKIQEGYPAVHRNSDKPFLELSSEEYASQLTKLVSSLLATLASTAPLEVEKRARVSKVLQLLISSIKSYHPLWFKHLVSSPSADLLRFLGLEQQLLQNTLQ